MTYSYIEELLIQRRDYVITSDDLAGNQSQFQNFRASCLNLAASTPMSFDAV